LRRAFRRFRNRARANKEPREPRRRRKCRRRNKDNSNNNKENDRDKNKNRLDGGISKRRRNSRKADDLPSRAFCEREWVANFVLIARAPICVRARVCVCM